MHKSTTKDTLMMLHGLSRPLSQWVKLAYCKELQLTEKRVIQRKKAGWTDIDALTVPWKALSSNGNGHKKKKTKDKPVIHCLLTENEWKEGLRRMRRTWGKFLKENV